MYCVFLIWIMKKIFKSASQQLCDLIYDCLWSSMRARAAKGLAMTANYWSFMTEQVVNRFHFSKRISIGVVMTETIIKEMKKPLIEVVRQPIIDKAFKVYNILNCAHLEQWNSARKISVQYMATFFIEQMTRSHVLSAFKAARQAELQKEFLALVEAFLALTELERFCAAREGKFPCVHTKFSHSREHYNPSITGYRGNRGVRMINLVHNKADTSWAGEFKMLCNVEREKRELIALALGILHQLKYIEPTPRNFVLVRRELWKGAFLQRTAIAIQNNVYSVSLPAQLCTLCFHDVSFSSAQCHSYCETCMYNSYHGDSPLSGSHVSDRCVIVHTKFSKFRRLEES